MTPLLLLLLLPTTSGAGFTVSRSDGTAFPRVRGPRKMVGDPHGSVALLATAGNTGENESRLLKLAPRAVGDIIIVVVVVVVIVVVVVWFVRTLVLLRT